MTSSVKMLTLISNDGEGFDIPINIAEQSKFIKNILDVVEDSNIIPVDNVNSVILAKVIEYLKKHAEATTENGQEAAASGVDELKRWDAEFVKLDYDLLLQILLAANYMDIKSLFDLCCWAIADKIKNKTPEQVRQILNLENDFSPYEEEQIRKQNEWAYEVEED